MLPTMVTAAAAGTEINVHVNGEPVATRASTLAALIDALGYQGLKVATALNGDFVPERKRAETRLGTGDRIEVVAPRQGG
jgi:sulfur carrier protein